MRAKSLCLCILGFAASSRDKGAIGLSKHGHRVTLSIRIARRCQIASWAVSSPHLCRHIYIHIYIYHSGSRAPSSESFPRRFRRTMRCVCAECRRCRGTVIGHCCDAPTGARAAPATHLNIKITIHTHKYVSKQIYTHIFIYVYIFLMYAPGT